MPAATAVRPVPTVLIADDDPPSRLFFSETLRGLGAEPTACVDGASALERALAEPFDLLLLDCRMPNGGARDVLRQLRRDPAAASRRSPAVATSAELQAEDRRELHAAGFCDVLLKPCGSAELSRLARLLWPAAAALPLLDDAPALASTGDPAIVDALRGLLHEELAGLYRELDELGTDNARFGERLHRLRSSCGFCGATALAGEISAMQDQLRPGQDGELQLAPLRQALLATIEALEGRAG